MYQVRGKVTNKDGSVPKAGIALVSFVPTKDSTAEVKRSATGPIAPDGTFSMSTRLSGDGVNAGDYNVVFNIAKSPVDPTPLVLPQRYYPMLLFLLTKSPSMISITWNTRSNCCPALVPSNRGD